MGFLRDTYRSEVARLEADLASKKKVKPWDRKREPTQAENNAMNSQLMNILMSQQRAAQNIGRGLLHQTLGGLR